MAKNGYHRPYQTYNFAAHTFVLSKQSSIRDSVDAAYHMRIYQVKNTQYYYYKI